MSDPLNVGSGRRRAQLIALVEAPGGPGARTATALARSLAAPRAPGAVLLADLSLDAGHRSLHGIDAAAHGVGELAASCWFGPPPAGSLPPLAQRTASGYDLVPGLRRHHDWVGVGARSADALLEALRHGPDVVIAHVDRDLEGERDTGSCDVEDRNVLARSTVRAADLVVVAGDIDRFGRHAVLATVVALAAFGVAPERTLIVTAGVPWTAGRPPPWLLQRTVRATHRVRLRSRRRLVDAVTAALLAAGHRPPPPFIEQEPQPIVPDPLGP